MPRRPVTSMDPWQATQDELDRLYEHAPANDRPLFPPSPTFPLPITGTSEPHHDNSSPGGQHQAPTAAPPTPPAAAVGASVPNTDPQE